MKNAWQGAADWLRNNYQDYANVASLCDAMLAASPTAADAVQVPYGWVNAGTERQQTEYATLNVGPENPWVDGANAFPVYTSPRPAAVMAGGQRGDHCEVQLDGEWHPARFIATDLVGGEPIVQRDKCMPVFATWGTVRGQTNCAAPVLTDAALLDWLQDNGCDVLTDFSFVSGDSNADPDGPCKDVYFTIVEHTKTAPFKRDLSRQLNLRRAIYEAIERHLAATPAKTEGM